MLKWTAEHETASVALKQHMIKLSVLLASNLDKEFVLHTDTSDRVLGAVLLQEENHLQHPVFYASKRLLDSECNHPTVEKKECLAAVWTVKKFLYLRHFRVQTDHQPLEYVTKTKMNNGRVMKWSLALHTGGVQFLC